LIISNRLIAQNTNIEWAKIQGSQLVEVRFENNQSLSIKNELQIDPFIPIRDVAIRGKTVSIFTDNPFRLDQHYYLKIRNIEKIFLVPDNILNSLYSDKSMGFHREGGWNVFRIFAPRAKWVRLVVFDNYSGPERREFIMSQDKQGVWQVYTKENWTGKYYGFRVWGPTGEGEMFDSTIVVADPFSRAVVTRNEYQHRARTLILPGDEFDWAGDSWMQIPMRDLIIYEMHVRDMTAHSSSRLPLGQQGYYKSLIRTDQNGGLPYILKLGVNAVELLPAQDFANIEVPYKDNSTPVYNTWNPYERNHWGYMTSYFFAPESYYATGGTMERDRYNGIDGRQVYEFKEMVKSFHRNGIAVVMDVVYNHVSQYDFNPFKYIDKFYYFRLKPDCSFESVSGCGNDFNTERPMARKMILESVKLWLKEYHVDGFRFDLALMIDKETCRQVLTEARKINPYAIIIAEPWGGGYDPNGFSDIGWASWNDKIRNGVKGQNPQDGLGFIFGKFQGENNRKALERYVQGSLRSMGGQYIDISHSINYLESHDDHTMSDFIRIGLGEVDENQRILDVDKNARLTPRQMKLNKLAALFLFASQGPVMIHEGQEFARSKVIAKTAAPDENWGKIDHNSYNKDNETNYINYKQATLNSELLEYYQGLIRIRKKYATFRAGADAKLFFHNTSDPFLLIYNLNYKDEYFVVGLNGNPNQQYEINKPQGNWNLLVDGKGVYLDNQPKKAPAKIVVPPSAGFILIRVN
jgi:pullulanase/glycogen debranching enzyme